VEIVHTPVLLEETLSLLAPRAANELMLDATLGEAGHSLAFLSRFPALHIIGVDADTSIQEIAKERLSSFGNRMAFYQGWSYNFFTESNERFDTILIDSGVSLFHYMKSGRGFSFINDEALDMRLDQSSGTSAAELIAALSEEDLANLLYNNAEERYSRRIARAIVAERSRGAISSTHVLAEIVRRAVPAPYRYGAMHPATKTFQALRIVVNGELLRLPSLLETALKALKGGGRLGVITFHSLEDRIVKHFFREQNGCGTLHLVNKKALSPSDEEKKRNPASRSAHLRVIEKVEKIEKGGERNR
jgi:16S rRNA (cytosine1402-N4)-methyltransferase